MQVTSRVLITTNPVVVSLTDVVTIQTFVILQTDTWGFEYDCNYYMISEVGSLQNPRGVIVVHVYEWERVV